MKHARMVSHWARARPCPVSPDTLLALLDGVDANAGYLLAGSTAVASLTADMVTRKDDSVKLACGDVATACAALVHTTKRAAYCSRRRIRMAAKRVDACVELLSVTAKQLRVWGSPALVRECVLEGVAVGCALTSAHPFAQVSTVTPVCYCFTEHLMVALGPGRVALGDGLRVVSAAGPGLNRFEPHSRNKFSVVLAQADGSVPVWLTSGDVVVDVLSPVGNSAAARYELTAAAAVQSEWVQGTVSVVYSGLNEDAPEALFQLSVCGAFVADAAGDGDWCVRVPRKPLAGHNCAAAGTHLRSMTVVEGAKYGRMTLTVSADERWLVVGLVHESTLFVYSLPGGEPVRTFGGRGAWPLQFMWLSRLCFAPNGNLIVADWGNKRLQEVTLEGDFVRFIDVGDSRDFAPFCVAVHDDVIAVGCYGSTGPPVVLFDFGTGTLISQFGEVGIFPGQLSKCCPGIWFTPDGSHIVVSEDDTKRLSMFTAAGLFVRCVGVGVLGEGCNDVLQSVSGEYVVADYENGRVCVFSPDGSELVRSWGAEGAGYGFPTAFAAAGRHLYVIDASGRVQVYE